jgi:Fic/DOC family
MARGWLRPVGSGVALNSARTMAVAGTARQITARWTDGVPYQALVPAGIADLAAELPPDLAGRLAGLEAAVRAVDSAVSTRRNSGALVRSLIAAESLPSQVIRALVIGERVDPSRSSDADVRRFDYAVSGGVRASALTARLLLWVHGQIVTGGGALRAGTIWVGPAKTPANALFVPAPADELAALLDDLVAYLDRDDVPVAAAVGVAFAQLEFVHAFADGNGRLGRWLLQVLPRRRGLVRSIFPPMGLTFAADQHAFFAAHTAYRDGDVETWLRYFADRLEFAVQAVRLVAGPA